MGGVLSCSGEAVVRNRKGSGKGKGENSCEEHARDMGIEEVAAIWGWKKGKRFKQGGCKRRGKVAGNGSRGRRDSGTP